MIAAGIHHFCTRSNTPTMRAIVSSSIMTARSRWLRASANSFLVLTRIGLARTAPAPRKVASKLWTDPKILEAPALNWQALLLHKKNLLE